MYFLIRHFIPNFENVSDLTVRKKYGVLSGVVGIILNLLLFSLKLVSGLFINSIAVISDAFNNLSDMGSALVSLIGARLGGKRADREHPYGHGRAEYISALIISFLIIICGVELIKTSIGGFKGQGAVIPSPVVIAILCFSVLVKLYMWYFNSHLSKKINSDMLRASAKDSLFDAISTTAVTAAAVVSPYVSFPLDGIVGIAVSLFIMVSGIRISAEISGRLMGKAPDDELIADIERILTENKYVLGTHDLMVHDYGPDRIIASVHAELPSELSLTKAHNIVDETEKRIMDELSVDIVVHIDPVAREI